ncbi:MAG: EamA family transporter, partial [Armatimonadetes bacterium CG17_big_fil_post_rev_8_21_14_2_50_66_6]
SGIVFGAFYGLWLLDDTLDPREWLGMTIIVVSGIAATALRNRVLPDNAAEEH